MNSRIKIDEIGPIISSSHLVSEKAVELSEFEFGLIIANNAFERWMTRCMAAAGVPDLKRPGCSGPALHQSSRSGQETCRSLLRAECRRYPHGQLCVEKARKNRPCGKHQKGQRKVFHNKRQRQGGLHALSRYSRKMPGQLSAGHRLCAIRNNHGSTAHAHLIRIV